MPMLCLVCKGSDKNPTVYIGHQKPLKNQPKHNKDSAYFLLLLNQLINRMVKQ